MTKKMTIILLGKRTNREGGSMNTSLKSTQWPPALLFMSWQPLKDWGVVFSADDSTRITSIQTPSTFVCLFCFLSGVGFFSQVLHSADAARQSTLGTMFVFILFTSFYTLFSNILVSNSYWENCLLQQQAWTLQAKNSVWDFWQKQMSIQNPKLLKKPHAKSIFIEENCKRVKNI